MRDIIKAGGHNHVSVRELCVLRGGFSRTAGAGGLGRPICSGVGGSKAVVGAYESAEGKVGEEQGKVRHRSAGRSGTEPKKA